MSNLRLNVFNTQIERLGYCAFLNAFVICYFFPNHNFRKRCTIRGSNRLDSDQTLRSVGPKYLKGQRALKSHSEK